MGVSVGKCCVADEPSHSDRPEGKSYKKARRVGKNVTSTDEFISQYGSHFSSTSTSSCTSSSSSFSSGSHTTTYSYSESTRTATDPTSKTDAEESHRTVSTYLDSHSHSGSTHIHAPSHSYQYSNSMLNLNTIRMHQPQGTFVIHDAPSHSLQYSNSNTIGIHQPRVPLMTHDCSDGKCTVTRCDALQRIIKGLQWHATMQSVNVYDYDDTIQGLAAFGGKYRDVMDDYQHLLMDHLFEVDAVRKEVGKYVTSCHGNEQCTAYKRYTALCSKDLSQCDDTQFFLNIMDLIHCYIMHSTAPK